MWHHREWGALSLEDCGVDLVESELSLRLAGVLLHASNGRLADSSPSAGIDFDLDSQPPVTLPPEPQDDDCGSIPVEVFILNIRGNSSCDGWVRFDSVAHQPSESFFICPLYVAGRGIACLVLQQTRGEAKAFERIGFAAICGNSLSERETTRKTVRACLGTFSAARNSDRLSRVN